MAVVRRRDDCIHKPVCVECGAISCPAECGHYIKVEKFTSYNSAMLEIALCVQRVFTIANLTRYENLLVGDMSDEREMIECATGSYVKFEEAVEASSNSIQQLKAEIRAISDIIIEYGESGIAVDFSMLKRRLRELSAV